MVQSVEYYSAIKIVKPCHLQQYGWRRGYHAKWNKSEKDRCHMISLMWNLKNKHTNQNKNRLIDKENKLLPERRGVRVDETDDGD